MKYRLKSYVICCVVMAVACSSGVHAQQARPEPEPTSAAALPESPVAPAEAVVDQPTSAAAEPAAAAPRASQSRLVEEIIVTAQKREEKIQDVPITIQAFTGEALDALGIQTTQDLQIVTPSLNFGEFVGYSIIFLRGVGTDAFLTADPSVATYVDGVYLPFSFGQTADFGSIERVEVLKGPQGTLFGRNAVGGAISVYSRDPTTDEAFLDLSTSYGRFNDVNVKGTANLPVSDTFAVSIAANYHRNDFYYDGTYADGPTADGIRGFGPELGRGVRFKVLWTPSTEFDVLGAFAYNDFDGYGTSVTPNTQPTPAAQLIQALTPDYTVPGNYQVDLNQAGLGYFSRLAYGRVGYRPGPVDIKLSGSYQYTGNYQFYDFDGSNARIAEFDSSQGDGSGVRATTAELQFTSNAETPFSERFQWVAGAYFFDSQAGFRKPATLYVSPIEPITGFLGATADALANFAALQAIVLQSPTGRIGFTSGVATESYSGYAQGTFFFTDWASLTLGGRYQTEKRIANESGTWLEQLNGNFVKIINRAPQDSTTNSFSPKISLEVRPAEGYLLYTSYQEATKSGTYNTVNIYDAIDFVEPEEIKAYEVGAKTELFDGLRLNAAAWYYKQRDLQTQFVSLLKGGAVSFETAGAARSRGVEFDVNWLILPDVVDDLVLIASGAYVDAVFTSYPDASGFNQTTGVLQQNLDFSGNRVPQAAKYTGSIQLNKTFQLTNGSIEVGGDVYYNSGFFWTAQNTQKSKQESYQLVGARASYFYAPRDIRITAFATNLLDERYNRQEFTVDFGVFEFQAPPVEYGLRVELQF